MNITITKGIPQQVDVSTPGFSLAPQVNASLLQQSEVTIIGLPGPEGPPSDQITVSDTPPSNPEINDLWVDLS